MKGRKRRARGLREDEEAGEGVKRVIGVQTETIRKVDADVPLLGFAAAPSASSRRPILSFLSIMRFNFPPGKLMEPFLFFSFFFLYIFWKLEKIGISILECSSTRTKDAVTFSLKFNICAIEILFKISEENDWIDVQFKSKINQDAIGDFKKKEKDIIRHRIED